MSGLDVVAVLHASMVLGVKLCAPVLLATLAAGLLVSVVQAVTQISDSTLSFLPKLVAAGAGLWLAGPALARALADYARHVFEGIVRIGGQ